MNKENINRHRSTIDIDELWKGIEPKVDLINAEKKRKKRFVFFWISGASIIMLGLLAGLLYKTNDDDKETLLTVNQIEDQEKEEINTVIESTHLIDKERKTSNAQQGEKHISPNHISSNSLSSKASKSKLQLAQTSSPKTALIVSTNKSEHEKSGFFGDEQLHAEENPLERQSKYIATNPNDRVPTTKDVLISRSFSKNCGIPETRKIFNIPLLPIINPDFSHDIPGEEGIINHSLNHLRALSYSSKKRWDFSLSPQFGIYKLQSLYQNSSDSRDYSNLVKEVENQLDVISFGLNVKLKHQSGLFLTSGFDHSTLSEKLNHTQLVQDTISEWSLEFIVNGLDGDTTHIYGYLDVFKDSLTSYTLYNKHTISSIPLLLGYERWYNNWLLGVQAGILAQIRFDAKGNYVNQNRSIREVNQDLYYKSSLGIGFRADLLIGKTLGKYSSIYISPSLVLRPNVLDQSYGLSKKYLQWGGILSINYTVF